MRASQSPSGPPFQVARKSPESLRQRKSESQAQQGLQHFCARISCTISLPQITPQNRVSREGRQPGPDPKNPPKNILHNFCASDLALIFDLCRPARSGRSKTRPGANRRILMPQKLHSFGSGQDRLDGCLEPHGAIRPGQGQPETATFICLACCSYFHASG